jgi:hypothetical protein
MIGPVVQARAAGAPLAAGAPSSSSARYLGSEYYEELVSQFGSGRPGIIC